MRKLFLNEIVKATSAKLLSQVQSEYDGVGTDTRKDLTSQLFIALKGDNFDAHQFLDQAVKQGASALLVHDSKNITDEIKKKATVFLVDDTLKALQSLGNNIRKNTAAKIVGITGSNGKTTTKEFCAAVLAHKFKVHYNKGSLNNHWGVPLNLLEMPIDTEVAVVEMGMNHAGEITELVKIAEPNIVVCTMVGRAHIEFFGSIEKIAEAKEEIYLAANSNSVRIYNLDNSQTKKMYDKALKEFSKDKILSFSENQTANVQMKITQMTMSSLTLEGQINQVSGKAVVNVFGHQNLTNLMAAAAVGLATGMTPTQIWKALESCKTTWGRNQLVHLRNGAEIIFDGYNANPDSMRALIENMSLLTTSGKKIGVFGQMRELGGLSKQLHTEVAELIGRSKLDSIYFVGEDAESFKKGIENSNFKGNINIQTEFTDQIAKKLSTEIQKGDIVLIKGSRGMKLERFVFACEPLDFEAK